MPGRPTGSPSRSSPWRGDPDGIDSRRYRAGGAGRSFRRAAILAQSRQESVLDIHGHCNARNNARPELDRWRRDEVRREGDRVEIIREVWYRPAVPRATEHARMALSIVTDATEVPPARVGQEDIGARIQPGLCAAFEPTTELGEARHLEGRRHSHEKVDILRPRLARDH